MLKRVLKNAAKEFVRQAGIGEAIQILAEVADELAQESKPLKATMDYLEEAKWLREFHAERFGE